MRVLRTALLTAAILLVTVVAATPAAHAHAEIRESEPPAGGTAPTGTRELVLRFISLATDETVTVTVTGPDGADVVDGSPVVFEDQTVEVPLRPLEEGEHRVEWTAVSSDGDGVTEGSFTFTAESAGGGLGVWFLWIVALAIPVAIFLRPGFPRRGSRRTGAREAS